MRRPHFKTANGLLLECSKCKLVLALDEFYPRNNAEGEPGFSAWCKPCTRFYRREQRKDPARRDRERSYARAHARRKAGIPADAPLYCPGTKRKRG